MRLSQEIHFNKQTNGHQKLALAKPFQSRLIQNVSLSNWAAHLVYHVVINQSARSVIFCVILLVKQAHVVVLQHAHVCIIFM